MQNIDLLGNRWLNLEQCSYTSSSSEGFDRRIAFISSNSAIDR